MLSNTSLNKNVARAAEAGSRELTAEELTQVGGAWAASDTGYYDDPYGGYDSYHDWDSGYAELLPSEPYYEPYNPYPDYPPSDDGGFGSGSGSDPYYPEPVPPYPDYPVYPDYPAPEPYPDYYYCY